MTPGWYGKLPTLGDFASRRLPPAFVEPWDLWLGEGIAAQRSALGEAWLEAYLNSAVWRFVLAPGVVLPQAMAGVLMASVDRVGRYFPLTIATPLARLPGHAAEVEGLLGWLHRLEDLALDALQDDWSIEQLDAALEALPDPVAPAGADGDGMAAAIAAGGFVDIGALKSRGELAGAIAAAFGAASSVEGRSFWLADNPAAPRLLVSQGLPTREQFIAMLDAGGRDDPDATIF